MTTYLDLLLLALASANFISSQNKKVNKFARVYTINRNENIYKNI